MYMWSYGTENIDTSRVEHVLFSPLQNIWSATVGLFVAPPAVPFPEIGAASTMAIGKADPLACHIFSAVLLSSPV